ncbi:uncharacterized protein LOC126898474 isoform X2 [Daktulosphaira vitifoliae]|nr:uncharacterized protein LOC126898474 isoform X2 [Daktulosphaira vitifoliae]XP_050528480.1 uncharacterized protein LOC126898474 isoform X2 [Daktulosphaira vitifoliae]
METERIWLVLIINVVLFWHRAEFQMMDNDQMKFEKSLPLLYDLKVLESVLKSLPDMTKQIEDALPVLTLQNRMTPMSWYPNQLKLKNTTRMESRFNENWNQNVDASDYTSD